MKDFPQTLSRLEVGMTQTLITGHRRTKIVHNQLGYSFPSPCTRDTPPETNKERLRQHIVLSRPRNDLVSARLSWLRSCWGQFSSITHMHLFSLLLVSSVAPFFTAGWCHAPHSQKKTRACEPRFGLLTATQACVG